MLVVHDIHHRLIQILRHHLLKTSSVVHAAVPRLSQQKNKVTDFSAGLVPLKRKISARNAVTNGGQEGEKKLVLYVKASAFLWKL